MRTRAWTIGWSFQRFNEDQLDAVLKRPWTTDNQTFRDRCWTQKKTLISVLQKNLVQAFIRGDALDKVSTALAKEMNVARSKAARLVQTEASYFANNAQKRCYKDLDVERVEVVETLDSRTCDTCGSMDGKVIKLSDAEPGITIPPYHPNCRGCTAPYFEDDMGDRIARNLDGDTYYVPSNMNFEEWKKQQEELYGQGTVDKLRKMSYNESADKAQFEDYKSRLGADAPENFEAFQKIKYGNPTDYDELCGLYSYKGRVPEATYSDYKAYKAVKAAGITGSVRVPPMGSQRAYILEDKAAKRDPAHIMRRMMERHIMDDDVQSYVDNALFSVSQFKDTRRVFYSEDGVTVLTRTKDYPGIDWIAKTTWSKYDFDEITEKAIKEALRNGK